jgi:hypothetical protein
MSTPGEGEEGKLEEDILQDVGRPSQRSLREDLDSEVVGVKRWARC